MNLNELRDRAYKTACEHGFHEKDLSNDHFLCLVIAELMEAVEADRKGKHADVAKFKEWQMCCSSFSEDTQMRRFEEDFRAYIKDSVEDEISDAVIRLLDFAGFRKIDLDDFNYIGSDTEDYSEKSFTESMFCITRCLTDKYYAQRPAIILNEIFAFCRDRDIDWLWHVEQKMRYNELRCYKHGKAY